MPALWQMRASTVGGDNSRGQLGNRTNASSSVPIAVDIQSKDVTPAPVMQTSGCGGWWQPPCRLVAQPTKPKSGLGNKEVIDIAAGENFTCALSSDGSVACWGMGGSGQLGNNNTSDTNYPAAVYAGGAFAGKKGVKLAKASNSTMCVLAIDSAATATDGTGQPYCWGYGIDNGTGLPANTSSTVACNATSTTVKPTSTTVTTIFQSPKPVRVAGETLVAMDGGDYITGLSTSGRAQYWGMYGYIGTTSASNITSCTFRKCTGVAPTIRVARYNHSTGGNTTGGHNQQNSQGQNVGGGGNNNNSCTTTTRYGFTKSTVYRFTGKNAETTPPAWSSSQGGYKAVSGNVFNGLYCATTGGATNCDAHGTAVAEGQTGSGYTRQCTTTGSWIFTQTTCVPDPAGPQTVRTDGWLAGKTIKELSTGTSGYTCALTTDSMVGCWGVNTSGQLGNGTTVNKNVPTKVEL